MAAKQRTLQSSDPGFEQWYQVVEEFSRESERAGVILGGARLDELLYQLLDRVLVPVPGNRDELLDQDGPLSSFGPRIHAAYRLGLISAPLARTLHLIRKIRNAFAHESAGATLDAGAHRDRVRELTLPYLADESFVNLRKHFARDHFRRQPAAVIDFYTVLAKVLMDLNFIVEEAEPLTAVREGKPSSPPTKSKAAKPRVQPER
jgi:hypothetical protein